VLAVIGAGIIFGLAFYAGKLLTQLKAQRQAQEKAQQESIKQLATHDTKVLNSVEVIVRAMKEEQCEFAEGAWRLSVLISSLKLTDNMLVQFPAIVELYESIQHHAILDDRKQLPKKERMKQDVERMQVEAKLSAQISQELEKLHELIINKKIELNS